MTRLLRLLLVAIACSSVVCRQSRPLGKFRSRVIQDIQSSMVSAVGIYTVMQQIESGVFTPAMPEVEALHKMRELFDECSLPLNWLPSELRGSTATLVEEVTTKLRVVKQTTVQHVGAGLEILVVVEHGITLWSVTMETTRVDRDMYALSKLVENIVRDYFTDEEALQGLYVEKTRRKCEADVKDALFLASKVRTSANYILWGSWANVAAGGFGTVLGGVMMIPGLGLPCQIVGGMGLLASAAMTVVDLANLRYIGDLTKPLTDFEHFLLEAKETIRRLELGTKLRQEEINDITAFAERVKESASEWRRMA